MTTYGPYPARVVSVHDGDTVTLDIDLGFSVGIMGQSFAGKTQLAARVFGINAPELSTDAGKVAHAYAQTLLPTGLLVTVTSHLWDKYGGRFDGTITLPDGRDFATLMVQSGNAVLYLP